jgi:enamine deaminase RidA (YjgF/YER057c/UK114 family)
MPARAGYSHAVAILPRSRLVWTSGQVGMDADGNVPSGWEAQTRLVFKNIGRALSAAGRLGRRGQAHVLRRATDELQTVRAVRDEITPERASDVYGHGSDEA